MICVPSVLKSLEETSYESGLVCVVLDSRSILRFCFRFFGYILVSSLEQRRSKNHRHPAACLCLLHRNSVKRVDFCLFCVGMVWHVAVAVRVCRFVPDKTPQRFVCCD